MATRRKAILETPNRRRRKRRRAIRLTLLAIIFIVICIAVIIGVFRIPALQVREVIVTGTSVLDPAVLRADAEELSSGNLFYVFPRKFILLYPREEIQKSLLLRHNEISAVSLSIRASDKVEIVVSERFPQAVYCAVACFYLDSNGLAYQETQTTTGFTLFRDVRPDYQASSSIGIYPLKTKTFNDVKGFADKLIGLGLHFNEVTIEPADNMSVMTKEGRLIISTKESLDGQFEFLRTALTQEIFKDSGEGVRNFGYIDLRFGKKIFYRLDGEMPLAGTSTATSSLVQ